MVYKIMKKIYVVLCNAIMCALPLHSMEIDLSQSTTDFPPQFPIEKIKKDFSSLRKAMNKDFTQKTTKNKAIVHNKIKNLVNAHVLEVKNYQYTQDSKIDIMNQFFTQYPDQLCSELQLINLNNTFGRQDFVILLSKLETKNVENIISLKNIIQKKPTKSPFTIHEIEMINKALKIICSKEEEKYAHDFSSIIDHLKATNKAKKIGTRIKKTKTSTLDELKNYQKNLQYIIANFEDTQNVQEIAQKNKYLETLENVTERIDLLIVIDEQLKINYKELNLNQLFEYIEFLDKLRKQLTNFSSEHYKKLDIQIKDATAYYREKIKTRNEEQLLEQKRLAQLKEKQEAEALNKQLDDLIKEAEEDLNKKVQAKRKTMQQEQQKLEEARLEQEKRKEEMTKNLARLERDRLARKQLEQQEAQRLKQERIQQENAKRWTPWITNRFNQTRQTVFNFVNGIGSTITSWWSWFMGQ